jgi:hypothetical protein
VSRWSVGSCWRRGCGFFWVADVYGGLACRETAPDWDQEIAGDVREECSKYGPVTFVHVDRDSKVRGCYIFGHEHWLELCLPSIVSNMLNSMCMMCRALCMSSLEAWSRPAPHKKHCTGDGLQANRLLLITNLRLSSTPTLCSDPSRVLNQRQDGRVEKKGEGGAKCRWKAACCAGGRQYWEQRSIGSSYVCYTVPLSL